MQGFRKAPLIRQPVSAFAYSEMLDSLQCHDSIVAGSEHYNYTWIIHETLVLLGACSAKSIKISRLCGLASFDMVPRRGLEPPRP